MVAFLLDGDAIRGTVARVDDNTGSHRIPERFGERSSCSTPTIW